MKILYDTTLSGNYAPVVKCEVCGDYIRGYKSGALWKRGGVVLWNLNTEDGKCDDVYVTHKDPQCMNRMEKSLEAHYGKENFLVGWEDLDTFLADLAFNSGIKKEQMTEAFDAYRP